MIQPDQRHDIELRMARELAENVLADSPREVNLLGSQGNVNRTFEVVSDGRELILRVRFNQNDTRQFYSEQRCAELIGEQGCDWTPKVLQVGFQNNHSYSIQEKVSGTVGSAYNGDLCDVWEQVGRYASVFHQFEVPSYLYNIFEAVHEQSPWCQGYFDYLGGCDNSILVKQGILTPDQFQQALAGLEPLLDLKFAPTLAHGNLSLHNLVVADDGKVHIIDWGTCQGHLAEQLDLAELLVFDVPEIHIASYLKGHNLPDAYIQSNELLLERLKLARVITSANWLASMGKRELDLHKYIEKTNAASSKIAELST